MDKVSTHHALAINRLMLPRINTVSACFNANETDLNMFKMYVGDIAHNIAALQVFNDTLDAPTLHNSIMRQDTAPQEHFNAVLKYIEDNGLIPTYKYTCS